jgi:hypothetical protein
MTPPEYTITTHIGEECTHLNFFTNLKIKRINTIEKITPITGENKTSFG